MCIRDSNYITSNNSCDWPIATIIRGNIVMRDDEMIKPIGKPVLFQETINTDDA